MFLSDLLCCPTIEPMIQFVLSNDQVDKRGGSVSLEFSELKKGRIIHIPVICSNYMERFFRFIFILIWKNIRYKHIIIHFSRVQSLYKIKAT